MLAKRLPTQRDLNPVDWAKAGEIVLDTTSYATVLKSEWAAQRCDYCLESSAGDRPLLNASVWAHPTFLVRTNDSTATLFALQAGFLLWRHLSEKSLEGLSQGRVWC